MPAKDFFDTNVLIYAFGYDPNRTPKAERLLASGGLVSVQSLNEFVAVCRHKLKISWTDVKESLNLICILCPNPRPISLDTHKSAIKIAESYGYHIYDALIAASAIEAGCRILYSEDLQDGQVIDRELTIRNPFK